MHWLIIAFSSAALYGAYNFLIKEASDHIHQVAAALILQMASIVTGIALLLFFFSRGETFTITTKGVQLSIFAGLAVGFAEILSLYMFAKGVPASIGIPILVGGTVVTGVILGLIFAKESLTGLHVIGILLTVVGITMLTTKAS